jgi:hypothetical protein
MTITPSVIIRRASANAGAKPGEFGIVDVPDQESDAQGEAQESGERALLVFARPELAEEFRAYSGLYTEEEGFVVMPSSADQLRVVLWGGNFRSVALRGAEPEDPDQILFFEPADFFSVLLGSEYDPEAPLA